MLQPSSILVVDDQPANIGVLLDILSREYRLLVAEGAESCLEQLPHAKPDLLLLDVRMPGMDGFELCQALKKDPQWHSLPIIFMTAVDEPEEKTKALEMGAVDYVTKPVYVPEVLARIRTHLQILGLQRELKAQNEALEIEVLMRRETELQLEHSLDQGIIAATEDGQVLFSTRLAETLMQRFFDSSGHAVLPEIMFKRWKDERQQKDNQTWRHNHPESHAQLIVRIYEHPEQQNTVLFYLEEMGGKTPALLKKLGLSTRESEVLYWVAEGKTYPEVATILGSSVRTIHKHAENLFRKLNVESRAAAMRLALKAMQ